MSIESQFADGQFTKDCQEICLQRAGEHPLTVRGPGQLTLTEDRLIKFTIHAITGYSELFRDINRPRPIGEIIPDHEYFNLTASEYSGPVWTAEQIIPSAKGGLQSGIVYGTIYRLSKTAPLPHEGTKDYLTIRIPRKLKYPCTSNTEVTITVGGRTRHTSSSLNAAFVDAGDYSFEFSHDGEHTVAILTIPVGTYTPSLQLRVQESLQFVLAERVPIAVVESYANSINTVHLYSTFLPDSRTRMQPPLHYRLIDETESVWKLFSTYFSHIRNHPHDEWHPISVHVGSAIESSGASIDASVLGLAVATEGLIGECFPALAPITPPFIQQIEDATAIIRDSSIDLSLKTRLLGALSAMTQSRNSDKLREFNQQHNLPNRLFDSWKRLRNTSAHGQGAGGRDIATTFRLECDVLHLFYSIIFAAIGFAGHRTDYFHPGLNQTTWPPPESPKL